MKAIHFSLELIYFVSFAFSQKRRKYSLARKVQDRQVQLKKEMY